MAEFALIVPVMLLVLFVGIQFALIGQAALALSQLVYQGARYASLNPDSGQDAIATYMRSIASPTLTYGGATLTISVNPSATPRTIGTSVTVNASLSLNRLLFLPNPFLGASFPATLSNTQTAMTE